MNPNKAHHLLWSLFADADGAPRPRDFLFRAGGGERSAGGDFLVVSTREPHDVHGLWNIDAKTYDARFSPGQRLSFTLRANPTVSRAGKRHDVVMDAKRRLGKDRDGTNAEIWAAAGFTWLAARAPRLGVVLEKASFRADGFQVHRLRKDGERKVSVAALDLSGRLMVENPDKLRAALFSGVGHGKAYGCGLLLVKPA